MKSTMHPIIVTPVDRRLSELPRGNGDWPGYEHAWRKLQEAAQHLAEGKYTYLGYDHIETMARLGSGHEETMKAWLHVAYVNGWTQP